MNTKKRINTLTGLRFYMMIIIMLSHMEFLSTLSTGYIYSRFFHNAYVAVNFFFILSGFGLAYSYQKNDTHVTFFSSISYAIKRVKKIYPIYFVLLLICFPYCIYLSMADGTSLIIAAGKNIIKLILSIFLVQSSTGIAQLSSGLNSVSWFLSTLFLLYICCPLLLKVNEKLKTNAVAVYTAFFVNFILLLFSYYIFEFIENKTFFDSLSYTSPYSRIFYLISGILIYDITNIFCQKNFKPNTMNETLIILLNVFWFFSRNSIPIDKHIKYSIDFFLCVLLIFIFAFESGLISKFLSNDFHISAGNSAMYWFLIHYPVRLYVDELFNLLSICRNWISGLIEVIVIFTATFIITNIILQHKKKQLLLHKN